MHEKRNGQRERERLMRCSQSGQKFSYSVTLFYWGTSDLMHFTSSSLGALDFFRSNGSWRNVHEKFHRDLNSLIFAWENCNYPWRWNLSETTSTWIERLSWYLGDDKRKILCPQSIKFWSRKRTFCIRFPDFIHLETLSDGIRVENLPPRRVYQWWISLQVGLLTPRVLV